MNSSNRIITLLTDFGSQMGYVGQMKGVILSINPGASLVDLTHEAPAHHIESAGMILEQSSRYFPTGSIHLAVVDPGVGSDRPAIIVTTDHGLFVGPDNGLFGFLQKNKLVRSIHRIVNDRYFMSAVSNTFHGRDVFAPVVAYLSLGYPADEFGPPIDTLIALPSKGIRLENGELIGEVLNIDVFGNLITSIPSGDINEYYIQHADKEVFVFCEGQYIPIANTFSDLPGKELLAYVGSGSHLELAVNQGSAKDMLQANIGTPVKLVSM